MRFQILVTHLRGLHRSHHGLIHQKNRSHCLDLGDCGRLIQHCTDHHLVRQAKQLHARLILFSITPDNFLASKLINFYSKSCHLRQARMVFNQIPYKNTFSWNAMLIGYSLHNLHKQTLELFSSLVSSYSSDVGPDNFTVTCLLKALASSFPDSRFAKEVHSFVLRHGFESDVFVVNAMLTFYSRCDEPGFARLLFDRMPQRDVVSWNSMITGYSQGGLYEECKELYREMLGLVDMRPNGVTVVTVLQACGQSKDLILGMEVHKFVIQNQVKMDISLFNAIIGFYAKCGSLNYAREVFEEMTEKDEVSYGSLISGYMIHGFIDNAMDLFQKMEKRGLSTWNAVISGLVQNNHYEGVLDLVREMQTSGFRPNVVTLSSVLPSISYFSNLRAGKEIHAYAIRSFYDNNIYVSTAIVDTYAKLGFLEGSKWVFYRSKGRSLIIWTAIISAYAVHGDAEMSLALFYEMLNNGIQPDHVTFTSVLAACAHSGLVNEAWEIFGSMYTKYGIQPSVEHYACIVGALSRAGSLSDATELISKMPIEPSAKVWGPLLNAASTSGDVELGKFVYDHLFEIEPENTGNYIIMANLYSKAGRWEEACKIREKMNKFGLKKVAGNSWIETSCGIQSFMAGDVSNGRTEEIYDMLQGLLGLMKEEGYTLLDELDEESVYS